MRLGDALRRLDDRVLGPPRTAPPTTYRATFLLGVAGVLVVLGFVLVTGRTAAIGGVGGFVGVTVASGVRWYRARHDARR